MKWLYSRIRGIFNLLRIFPGHGRRIRNYLLITLTKCGIRVITFIIVSFKYLRIYYELHSFAYAVVWYNHICILIWTNIKIYVFMCNFPFSIIIYKFHFFYLDSYLFKFIVSCYNLYKNINNATIFRMKLDASQSI